VQLQLQEATDELAPHHVEGRLAKPYVPHSELEYRSSAEDYTLSDADMSTILRIISVKPSLGARLSVARPLNLALPAPYLAPIRKLFTRGRVKILQ